MKERLDLILVNKGFFSSREKAKAAIMAGSVLIDGLVFDKPGMSVDVDANITVKNDSCPYVSRGGLKLEKAIDEFNIVLKDAVCMDIGASTGGFTDCMLQKGVSKVYAFDVGYGQLDYKLRTDPRVINIERCNFRYFDDFELIEENIDFTSIDVSFISLKHIFPICSKMILDNSRVCALIKPQFEAGREQVGKKGIVRDKKVHIEVINKVLEYAEESSLYPLGISFSPITGTKGNIEYLVYLNKGNELGYNIDRRTIEEIVDLSNKILNGEV